mmetsp:Transcript_16622/g.43648  ORF Transcript_16622/g.43648 Transcript_16622/m.43648 type:complete len:196 (+) Transcript_16622:1-588(+)
MKLAILAFYCADALALRPHVPRRAPPQRIVMGLEPLRESATPIDIERFMGRWYVQAAVPTVLDRGACNAIEDYSWNPQDGCIDVTFTMRKGSTDAPMQTILQRATIATPETNTRWSLNPKVGPFYVPLALPYLVVDCAPDYSSTIIGLPDRSILYIMARSAEVDEEVLDGLIRKSVECGYEANRIERITHDYTRV